MYPGKDVIGRKMSVFISWNARKEKCRQAEFQRMFQGKEVIKKVDSPLQIVLTEREVDVSKFVTIER